MNRMEKQRQHDEQVYNYLERFGFRVKYFPRRRAGGANARWDRYIGKAFRVIARVFPISGNPMWVIEFSDGFRMAANQFEVLK